LIQWLNFCALEVPYPSGIRTTGNQTIGPL
jgi:hypothetical protein